MAWLNYHHLYYFWTTAREGSLTRASEKLRLAPPTLSAQIRALEDSLGASLFHRTGRTLTMTELGRMVYRHAEEIFTIGRELMAAVESGAASRPARLNIGVNESLPKMAVRQLLKPALDVSPSLRLVCREDRPEQLLAGLVTHELDVVLSDAPAPSGVRVKVFDHLLTECGVTFFAVPKLAAKLRRRFPSSLDGAPFLLPTAESALRLPLERWFEKHSIRPDVRAEFQDSSLLKAFAQAGLGVFAAASNIEGPVRKNYGVSVVGSTDELRERVYALSVERRITHPAVAALAAAARASG
jgi:LysR family transcriptional activator of nhaA